MVIGREKETERLREAYRSDYSEFVAVYGRRRVDKTFLVRETFDYQFTFQHAGIAGGNTTEELQVFGSSLMRAGLEKASIPTSWIEAFDMLARLIEQSRHERKVIFIDEISWMDTPRSGFLQALEFFWNSWASARKDILFIICGSATSWIVNKIINSHGGLHNRVTCQIALQPFTLYECEQYARSRGIELARRQLIECYMIMGGIPYYWSLLNRSMSLAQNVDELFFSPRGELYNEFNQLYASLFKNPLPYIKTVTVLGKKKCGMTREEIISEGKMTDNGLLTAVLMDLEHCGFIRHYRAIGKKTKESLFQLIDSFTLFYFKFLETREGGSHYWSSVIDTPRYHTWCGLAFERVCLMHVDQIKQRLGITGIFTQEYSWQSRTPDAVQIDLLIDRNDGIINLCEMKFSQYEFKIDKAYDAQLRCKKAIFCEKTATRKAVHITMVTTYGLEHGLYSDSIQSQVVMDDLFVRLS